MIHDDLDQEFFIPESFGWESRKEFNRKYRGSGETSRIILNFAVTNKIDSVGLGLILQLVSYLKRDKQRLYLVRAVGPVQEVLKAAGLEAFASFEYPTSLPK